MARKRERRRGAWKRGWGDAEDGGRRRGAGGCVERGTEGTRGWREILVEGVRERKMPTGPLPTAGSCRMQTILPGVWWVGKFGGEPFFGFNQEMQPSGRGFLKNTFETAGYDAVG